MADLEHGLTIHELELTETISGDFFVAVDDGTNTKKAKVANLNSASATSAQTYAQAAAASAAASASSATQAQTSAQSIQSAMVQATSQLQGYVDDAAASASSAAASEANIRGLITSDYAKLARSYATGDSGYREGEETDNAKYYSEQSESYVDDAAAQAVIAGQKADLAEDHAEESEDHALESEGHALGTQNGTPVSSDSPYYHNNAKYWADEARQASAGGVAASVIATAEPTNISSHAYAIGDQFVYNGILYTATSAISVGADIIPGTNCSISDTITEQIGNAGKVTGVKGNAESTYRTENVNISPADIGYFSGSTLSIGGSVPPSQNQGKFLKDNGTWSSAGHTILGEDGTTYPQRSKLQFEGCEITDDTVNGVTVVKCEGGGIAIVEVPTVTNIELIYDGTTKSPTITRDDAHTTITGTTEATEPGSYTFTVSLSKPSYMWTDNTIAPKTYTWGVKYDGSTVTPTDDIQTWLKCAMITDKSYTTLSEVLNDATTLSALMLSNNAADYLVRSTSWVSNITGNQTAMTDIGASDYCANTLLANSTWRTAICNSTYFESVLNVKVPTMTSNTTPSGTVIYSGYANSSYYPWYAFDGTNTNWRAAADTNANYIGYTFTSPVSIKKVYAQFESSIQNYARTFSIQASNDNFVNDVHNFGTIQKTATSENEAYVNVDNNDEYSSYRIFCNDVLYHNSLWGQDVDTLQFYGR